MYRTVRKGELDANMVWYITKGESYARSLVVTAVDLWRHTGWSSGASQPGL